MTIEETMNTWRNARKFPSMTDGGNFPQWLMDSKDERLGVQAKGAGTDELHGGADWVTLDMGDGLWLARKVDGASVTERGNLDDRRLAEFGAEMLDEPEQRLQEFKDSGLAEGMTAETCACPVLLLHDVFDALALSECYKAAYGEVADVWPMRLAGNVQDVAERLKRAHVTQVLALDKGERDALRRAGFDSELVAFESDEDVWRTCNSERGREVLVDAVYKAAQRFGRDVEGVTLEEADRAFGVFDDWQEPMPSGFKYLDRELNGGFMPGRLYMVAAAPSVGKTLFALQVAAQAAESGVNVAYFSTEMGSGELYARMVARRVHAQICGRGSGVYEAQAGESVEVTAYDAAKFHREEFSYLTQRRTDVQGRPFTFSEILGSGVTESILLIRSKFERMKQGMAQEVQRARESLLGMPGKIRFFENDTEGGMTLGTVERNLRGLTARFGGRWLVVVDFLGMVEVEDRRLTDVQKATQLVRGLKNLARKLRTPIFAVNSTSRSNYGQTGMGTARDSGNSEYACDVHLNLNFLDVVAPADESGRKGGAKETELQSYTRRDRNARRLDEVTHARLVTMDVAKNRSGRTSTFVEFMQWPQFSDMMELGLRESDYSRG